MPGSAGLRVGVAGATGALGRELVALLEESRVPVSEFVPMATGRSTGTEVEFRGDILPVVTEFGSQRGLDLLFLCAPAEASRELARAALHAEIPCIDLSGAMAETEAVPLLVADLAAPEEALGEPLLASPSASALVWSLVLAPLDRAAGLRRVVGTLLTAASLGGRPGMVALSEETLALINQKDLPEPSVFPRAVAFDCLPSVGEAGEGGASEREGALARDVRRLVGAHVMVGATALQIPVFTGEGSVVCAETERPLSPEEALAALGKAPGVEIWTGAAWGASLREAMGRDAVLVGRVRRDATSERGLVLWIAADSLRVAAANGVKLAELRLGLV